jgi:exonuclease VII small subunit
MMVDRAVSRVRDIVSKEREPSLDEALEKFQKAHEEMLKMEQVIQTKHRKLQTIVNRAKMEV